MFHKDAKNGIKRRETLIKAIVPHYYIVSEHALSLIYFLLYTFLLLYLCLVCN